MQKIHFHFLLTTISSKRTVVFISLSAKNEEDFRRVSFSSSNASTATFQGFDKNEEEVHDPISRQVQEIGEGSKAREACKVREESKK
jgi:hypothetical protein